MATIILPLSPADRFAGIIEAFRRAVAAQAAKNRPLMDVLVLVWSRLGRIARRVTYLAARIPADAPPRPHVRRGPCNALSRAARRENLRGTAQGKTAQHLPRAAGWVMRFIPASVYPARSQLQAFFADEAVQRLIAASPGIRRELRPLCRMLGLDPPPSPPPEPSPAAQRDTEPPLPEPGISERPLRRHATETSVPRNSVNEKRPA